MASRIRAERADAIAAYHAETGRRAAQARRSLAAWGVHLGPAPYGYVRDGGRHLVSDPAAAHVVWLIFWLRVAEDVGPTAITRRLAAHPLDCPAPRERATGDPVPWTRYRVARILANCALYTGRARLLSAAHDPAGVGAVTAYRTHPALIDDHTARRALRQAGRPIPRGLELRLGEGGA